MTLVKSTFSLCRRVMNNAHPCAPFATGVPRPAAAATAVKENPHHRNREKFDREKFVVNVGTLGAPHHGKTTLTSAVTRVLSKSHGVTFLDYPDIDHTALEKEAKHSFNTKHLEWWTDELFVAHSDLPGLTGYIKNTMAPLPALDVAILCVRADQGVAKETLMHYHVAKHMGVPTILPFINVSKDSDEELIDLVKMELEESFAEEDMRRIIVGDASSAQSGDDDAAVISLLDLLKNDLQLRPRDVDAPFLLHVEASGDIPNKGLFTGGRVVQGVAKVADNLEVFVGGITSKVVYKDVEIYKKITPELRAGDRGGGFLKKANKIVEIKRGSLIYDPDLVKSGWKATRNWKVKLRAIPGQGGATLANRGFVFHRGNNESVAIETSCSVSDKHDAVTEVTSRHEILAKIGDPIILRCDDNTFLGHLIEG